MPVSPNASANAPGGVPTDALIVELENQIGALAGQLARANLLLQAKDDEIRYLRSLVPADDQPTPEG